MRMKENFLWVSLETTGLRPENADLLEVSVGTFNDHFCDPSAVQAVSQIDFACPVTENAIASMPDYLSRRHVGSGLLDECRRNNVLTLVEFDMYLADWLKNRPQMPIGGYNTPWLYQWVQAKLPHAAKHLAAPSTLSDIDWWRALFETLHPDVRPPKKPDFFRTREKLRAAVADFKNLNQAVLDVR